MALEWELSTTTAKPAALQWQLLPDINGTNADVAINANYILDVTANNESNIETNTLEIIPAIAKPYAATQLAWEPVAEADIITPEQVAAEIPKEINRDKAIANAVLINNHSGPTYANYRALWRDGDWLPQISNTVPVGFGPQGVMASLTGKVIDCKTGPCKREKDFNQWVNTFNNQGSGWFFQTIGFGDPLGIGSLIITNNTEGAFPSLKSNSKFSLSSGNNTGLHYAKAIGSDTSIRMGVENLIRWDSRLEYADNRSAYMVLSQRIRIFDDKSKWIRNLYLTAGAGNGEFQPLGQQIQNQIAAQKAAGCSTFGYKPLTPCSSETRFNAVKRAGDYQQPTFIGAIGLELLPGINLISEWTGRNLSAGISFRPIAGIGLVITPMVENLVSTCDYGCQVTVSGYANKVSLPENVLTYRPGISLQASLEIKF